MLYRRRPPASALPHRTAWTAAGWTAYALDAYPGCRSAAAVLPAGRCVLRVRGLDGLRTVQIEPRVEEDGRIVHPDPAAAVSAVHAWLLLARRDDRCSPPQRLTCVIGGRPFDVHISDSSAEEAAEAV